MYQAGLKIGTCSWNFDSWVGLVYSGKKSRAVEYLPEYVEQFDTAEIDSWFYRIPDKRSVEEYRAAVPREFSFTCKVPQEITLTHFRKRRSQDPLEPNPSFLSVDRFLTFLEAVEPVLPQLDAIMFEFEYLNRQKMSGQEEFIDRLGSFLERLPAGLPYAVEPRNANYLNRRWFEFLSEHRSAHVFSEKQYMPHVWEVYAQHRDLVERTGGRTVIRLLGGDRKAMEAKTGGTWNQVVEPKDDDLSAVAGMIASLLSSLFTIVSVNNHYEGAAPITARNLRRLIAER